MKPRIFIGSSAKSLSISHQVGNLLADVGDCVVWSNAFTQNKSNLDSLIRQTKIADFSVLIATKDDILLKKDEIHDVARDNVIFEFGLFLGSTGTNRSYMLVEEGINLPTDLDGITLSTFTLETGKYNSLETRCNEIKQFFIQVNKGSDLGFLPSTALAIGYYYNFIRKVCEDIHTHGKILSGSKEQPSEVAVTEFTLHVVVPEQLDDDGIDSFKTLYNKRNNLDNASTFYITPKRGYPFAFKLDPPTLVSDCKAVQLYDIPTTLSTIGEALKLFMPVELVGQSLEVEHLERRELENFSKVLKYLIRKNVSTKTNVVVIDNATLD